MEQQIKALLAARGIDTVAPISLSALTVTRPYLLKREGIENGTAFLFAVPYYTTHCDNPARNISASAVSGDYHLFFSALFAEILPILREKFAPHRFVGFSDHSPIAEADAAVRAGLGFFGCNHLFLTKKYSSFVFLGEIITDAVLDTPAASLTFCEDCGSCRAACPVGLDTARCLSALTQKKGALTEEEKSSLSAHRLVWGCDRCQEVCPVTVAAKKAGTLYSKIPFFEEAPISHLTADAVQQMEDADFAARAYSWRGKQTVLRNLILHEEGEAQG